MFLALFSELVSQALQHVKTTDVYMTETDT